MSLPVLVVIVIFGIAAVVLAVHLTGGSQRASLADAQAAAARFAEDFPRDDDVRDVRLTADRSSAFLDFGSAGTGVVHAVGDRFLTRLLTPADVLAATRDGAALVLTLRDFTWRGGRFVFEGPDDAGAVASWIVQPDHNQTRRVA